GAALGGGAGARGLLGLDSLGALVGDVRSAALDRAVVGHVLCVVGRSAALDAEREVGGVHAAVRLDGRDHLVVLSAGPADVLLLLLVGRLLRSALRNGGGGRRWGWRGGLG